MRCCFCSCMSVWANFRRDEYYIMGHHSFLFSYNNSATFSFTFFFYNSISFEYYKKKKKQLLTDVFNTCKKQILIFFFCFHVMRRDELFPSFRVSLIICPLFYIAPRFGRGKLVVEMTRQVKYWPVKWRSAREFQQLREGVDFDLNMMLIPCFGTRVLGPTLRVPSSQQHIIQWSRHNKEVADVCGGVASQVWLGWWGGRI